MNLSERSICTLSTRIHQANRLRASLVARSWAGSVLSLSFGPEAAGDVNQFIIDESRCCPFFEFDVEEAGDHLDLTVEAPPEEADRLASLADLFEPGTQQRGTAHE